MVKKIMPIILGLSLTIGLTSCEKFDFLDKADACVNEDLIDPTAAVIEIWDPVCGCDEVTYMNSSAAKVYGGVTKYTKGACEEPTKDTAISDCVDPSLIVPDMPITTEWRPVCGCDGVTYSNPFSAKYHGGVTSYTDGECPGTSTVFGVETGTTTVVD